MNLFNETDAEEIEEIINYANSNVVRKKIADYLNSKLEAASTRVYGVQNVVSSQLIWTPYKESTDKLQAWLFLVEEIEKPKCEHKNVIACNEFVAFKCLDCGKTARVFDKE